VVYADVVIPPSAVIRYARGVLDSLPPNTSTAVANNLQTLRRITDSRDKGNFKADQFAFHQVDLAVTFGTITSTYDPRKL